MRSSLLICCIRLWYDYRYKCPKCRTPFCCVQCSKDHRANNCLPTSSSSRKKEEGDDDDDNSTNVEDESITVDSKLHTTKKHKRRKDDNDEDYDDEPGWNITPQMKELLHDSTWLRSTLQTEVGLRQLIHDIDGASDIEVDDDDDDDDTTATATATGGDGHKYIKKQRNKDEDISPRIVALARAKYTHPKFAYFIDKLLVTAGVLQQQQQSFYSSSSSSSGEGMGINDGAVRGHLTLVPVSRNIAVSTPATTTNDGQDDNDEQDDNESSSSSSSSSSNDDDRNHD